MAPNANQSWTEDESYPEIRKALANPYRSWPGEDLEAMLAAEGIEAEDLEDFLSGLKKVGQVVAGALPAAGAIAGTAIGGPLGTAIGGAAGQLAGRALGGVVGGAGARPAPGARGRRPARALAFPSGAPAAGQLLQLLARPEVQQALLSMLLGGAGRRSIPVGSTPVPVGAFANTLGVLANQAAVEYAERVPMASEGTPAYLMNFAGEALADPAVPEARAARLIELLADTELEVIESEDEMEDYPESWSGRGRGARSLDSYYDAIEQAELALAGEEW